MKRKQEKINGLTGGCMDGCVYGRMDVWTDQCVHRE